jgi:hypothetical protein
MRKDHAAVEPPHSARQIRAQKLDFLLQSERSRSVGDLFFHTLFLRPNLLSSFEPVLPARHLS